MDHIRDLEFAKVGDTYLQWKRDLINLLDNQSPIFINIFMYYDI